MRTRQLLLIAISSWAALALLASLTPIFVASDQAMQLKELQQYIAGLSPSLNHFVTVSPSSLDEPAAQWLLWWAPGTQILAYPMARAGLSIGQSVSLLACTAVLLGVAGWTLWWRLFEIPRLTVAAAALGLPWLRYAGNGLFEYSAETIAFAAGPWALLAAHAILQSPTHRRTAIWRALGTGLLAGSLYWVKYTGAFLAAGIAALCARRWIRSSDARPSMTAALAGIAIPPIALSLLNASFGASATMLGSALDVRVTPWMFVYAMGNPGLMVGDAGSLLNYVLTNQDHGLWRNQVVVAAAGVPASVTLIWMLARAARPAERLAAAVLASSMLLVLTAWILSPGASFEARHVAGASLASLPAAIAIARRHWAGFSRITRSWLMAAGIAYVALPWGVYSPLVIATKVRRAMPATATKSGVFNPLVSATDAGAALDRLIARCDREDHVWYVPDPLTALDIPEPMIVTHADHELIEDLAARRYHGTRPVCALLPGRFETTGKGDAIRASFTGVDRWSRSSVGALYDLWVGSPR